jgi:FKBP-type peptidyl-prolyl cis-trans isomerase 2
MRVFEVLTIATGVLLLVDLLWRPWRQAPAVVEAEWPVAEPTDPRVRDGDMAHIAYTMRCGGEIVAERSPEMPAAFVVRRGEVIRGLDSAVVGMEVGQSKHVVIPQEEAYGSVKQGLVVKIDRFQIPPEHLRIGAELKPSGSPHTVPVRLVEIRGDRVVLDAIHPLASREIEVSYYEQFSGRRTSAATKNLIILRMRADPEPHDGVLGLPLSDRSILKANTRGVDGERRVDLLEAERRMPGILLELPVRLTRLLLHYPGQVRKRLPELHGGARSHMRSGSSGKVRPALYSSRASAASSASRSCELANASLQRRSSSRSARMEAASASCSASESLLAFRNASSSSRVTGQLLRSGHAAR